MEAPKVTDKLGVPVAVGDSVVLVYHGYRGINVGHIAALEGGGASIVFEDYTVHNAKAFVKVDHE